MEIKDIATDKVIPYARNPRRNDAAVAAVARAVIDQWLLPKEART